MTIRSLEAMFKPRSVAVIGAGKSLGSVGSVLFRNLVSAGFQGDIFPVNPKHDHLEGHRCYPSIKSLPVLPDLAIIATPAQTIPEIIAELAVGGTQAAIIITAGYSSSDNISRGAWKTKILNAVSSHPLRILGPNCLGVMVPGHCLNGSFGHIAPLTGNLAFVAQSGAILTSVLDWATTREIGFSHFVSLGDMLDVDFGDMLDYLATNVQTRAILLYIESITNTRKFMSAARAAARLKPVIVVKGGRFKEGAQAAVSHTGALAGVDEVYDAAFRRAGILRVMDMEALFNAVETLALTRPLTGDRLAILTNGGGIGVLATDTLIEKKGRLANLAPQTIEKLNQVLPPTWSHTNPVDIIGDADGVRYEEAMSILLDDTGIDAILAMNCPTAIASCTESAQAVIRAVTNPPKRYRYPMLLTAWLGDGCAAEARHLFRKNRIPCFETPSDAVRGFMQTVRFQHNQEMLMETVPNIPVQFTPDTETVKRTINLVLSEGRTWLSEHEAKEVLSAYAIPVVKTRIANSPEKAARIAESIGCPVAVKIFSPTITHKSDIGGVALNLQTADEVRTAAAAMLERIHNRMPDARIDGFTVQPMEIRPHSCELIIGMLEDPQFGPVLLFGQGGTAVEVINDKAMALPPLNINLAMEVMARTRIYKLLQGYRDIPPAKLDDIALTLIKVSQLVCDFAEIKEIDINPLLADAGGVKALDARITVKASDVSATERLSIRPYPLELEEQLTLPDGMKLLLRPIRPEDEAGFQDIFSHLSPEEIRMRFLHPMNSLPHSMAARLTQIDYDREMALVLEGNNQMGESKLYGGVRIIADPDNENAEFAILLRREMTGSGLGPLLMRRIIDYSRQKGIHRLFGDVLGDNRQMLRLAGAFGFTIKPDPEDSTIRLVELNL